MVLSKGNGPEQTELYGVPREQAQVVLEENYRRPGSPPIPGRCSDRPGCGTARPPTSGRWNWRPSSATRSSRQCLQPGRPDGLAALGTALGQAGISIEGGGLFTLDGQAIAHFLVGDGEAALRVLTAAGIPVTAVREALARRLDQETRVSWAPLPAPWLTPVPGSMSCTPIMITA